MMKKRFTRCLAVALAAACMSSIPAFASEEATISLMMFQSWNSDAFEEILAEIEEEENIHVPVPDL